MTTFHDFEMTANSGEQVSLGEFKDQVALVVNVASACGLTPQYEGLEALHRELKDQGFTVLGFPCNQFGEQEPGTDQEIKDFACSRFDVTFPLFSKIEVNGEGAAPLYQWLKSEAPGEGESSDIQWNFEKFLVGRDGEVIARYSPMKTPEDIRDEVAAHL